MQWRSGTWSRCLDGKKRINAVVRDDRGRLLVGCNGGRVLRGPPDALTPLAVASGDVASVAFLEGERWVCAGLEGEVLLMSGEDVVARCDTGRTLHAALAMKDGEALLVGDGVHRLTREGRVVTELEDVWLQSVAHFKDAVIAFGCGVGLSGKPTYAFRKDGRWEVMQLEGLDGEFVSIAVHEGGIWVSTGQGLHRFSESEPAREVSDLPCTHVGVVGGRLVASGRGVAWVLEGGALQPL